MPLAEEHYGKNADGSPNTEYCTYCYADGAFTSDDTMEQMIDHCLKYLDEYNGASGLNLTPEEARGQMLQFFPMLKRWKV